ncbi:MAG: hypothetical protein A3J54_03520 [Candidatus Ryanbacteria bacterium RIFCSPHIGHO2_02_FULL_45_13b]|uniref:Uncharacterized protein n=1 Tax=Candidatus Ryanbacteria bacterium RIFCSPHIGHO2_02_FULL_45_13b TaxID=1802117 RepID=A0A1G2G4K5_9BACT|nr:MAG: hypothetical protein A3J54_03520 [Candidatus Ryanbacteria bacterium RIFCSPHIGHO2_02_FULL_45_13b]
MATKKRSLPSDEELTARPKSPDEAIVLGGEPFYVDFSQRSRIEAGSCRRIVTSEPTETWDDLVGFFRRLLSD